jgi:MinD superfamily P-loop ATPase
MIEISILSGKGGTGKTSITGALCSLAREAVLCDCDVDAPDLHLLARPKTRREEVFEGAWQARVDVEKCTACGRCANACAFDAIAPDGAGSYQVNAFLCEGCRLCERICPQRAIVSKRSTNNRWKISHTRFGTMVHAQMGPGEENSGKLVSKVREEAKQAAKEQSARFIISDGPPGIGCPVISTIAGTDRALIVTEPSRSALHDARRLAELLKKSGIESYALINKYDMDKQTAEEMEVFLKKENIPVLGRIPYDRGLTEAMTKQKSICEHEPQGKICRELKKVWETLSRG